MTWIKDFMRAFADTLYVKIFLLIGLALMIFLPAVAYWTYRPDIEDIDRFQSTEFKDKLVTEIFDLPSRVGKGKRQTFRVAGDDYHSYSIYLEDSEYRGKLKVGSIISKEGNSRRLTVLTGDKVYTFELGDVRKSRNIAMVIFFVMAFGWIALIVPVAYTREKAMGDSGT